MKAFIKEKYWHDLFEFGVYIKGFNGVWETISGLVFLFFSKATLNSWFSIITRDELIEDPNDRVINFLAHILQNLSTNTKIFAALYVLIHGSLNIFLAIQLYRDRHWAYLVTMGTMIIFMFYQIYRISLYHSVGLSLITMFDGVFLVLAWHEYRYHRERKVSL